MHEKKSESAGEITLLLSRLSRSLDLKAVNQLYPLVYDDLRRIAAKQFRRERRDHTLQPSALIHEAFPKLLRATRAGLKSRAHFFGTAKRAMAEVLIEKARAHNAKKRVRDVPLTAFQQRFREGRTERLDVRQALSSMAKEHPLWRQIVELRIEQGHTAREAARILRMGESTVRRECSKAKQWLRERLAIYQNRCVRGKIISHYRIAEKIGEGSTTAVYRAKDLSLGRDVAVKFLLASSPSRPEFERRFLQEAQCASAINHPNVVTVHEVACAQGLDFIVMEYVPGRTLDRAIPDRGLSPEICLRYAVQIVEGLFSAHAAGVLHRDLKPSNILVTSDGRIKLLDFGLAKPIVFTSAHHPRNGRRSLLETQQGTILGTIGYMSPEQVRGAQADIRSDIFSFGAVFYQMLTGRQAFQRENAVETMAAILQNDSRPLPQRVAACLRNIVERCLAAAPDSRFQTTRQLGTALRLAARSCGVQIARERYD